jgi:hypothetical protein
VAVDDMDAKAVPEALDGPMPTCASAAVDKDLEVRTRDLVDAGRVFCGPGPVGVWSSSG